MIDFHHIPVMPRETVDGLCIIPHGTYVDGTLGGGGHSALIADKLAEGGRIIGIDRDGDAIAAAARSITHPGFTAIRGSFHDMARIVQQPVHGILLDLGVSSHQLDTAARGFSYRNDGPLDMRMDTRSENTAANIVNTLGERDLAQILFDYGEERHARKIARAIAAARPLYTTTALAALVERTIPRKFGAPHPAMRTFQALRIAVNDELSPLAAAVESAVELLVSGGRIAVITFHSLEDRIVKKTFARLNKPCICPREMPYCACGLVPQLKLHTKKPIIPGKDELANNPRAHSAKLRIAEKI